MLEARLEEADLLKKVLDAVKELVTDANFDCSDEGIKLQAMDNSHVALVSLNLVKSGFSQYRCDRDMSLGMSLTSLQKIVKCAANTDTVTLRADESQDVLALLFEAKKADRVGEYEMKLMDIDQEHLGIPDTVYDAEIDLPSSEFARIIRDLKELGESVKIEVSKEGVRFSSEGDIGNASVTLKPTDRRGKEAASDSDDESEAEGSDAEDKSDEEEEEEEEEEEPKEEDEDVQIADGSQEDQKPTVSASGDEEEDGEASTPKKKRAVADSEDDDEEDQPSAKKVKGEKGAAVKKEKDAAAAKKEKEKEKKKKAAKKEKLKKQKEKEKKDKKKAAEKKKASAKKGKTKKEDEDQKMEVKINLQQAVSLTFSIKYLSNFAKSTPLSDRVQLHMSNEVPLLVQYSFDAGNVRYYLAPKIADE